MNALMIDIETLSLRPTAFVTQVGCCVADLDTGEYLLVPTTVLLPDNQPGSHLDVPTIRWWMGQDKVVAKGVFGTDASDRWHPDAVFKLFADVVAKYAVDEVWASPAMFDLPILTHMWGGRKPWKYNQERCMMTLYKRIDPDSVLAPPPNEAHHDAGADAKWQMDYLINLHRFMRDSSMQAVRPLESLG